MVKEIELTRGQVTLVDDEDFERVTAQGSWCASWYPKREVYAAIGSVDGELTLLHRFILTVPPGLEIDHKNLNPLDNRRCNLRFCTRAQNSMNRRKQRGVYSSKYKGVSRSPGRTKWTAYIGWNGKKNHLGQFDTEEEAASAYNDMANELFGDFAGLNVIESEA